MEIITLTCEDLPGECCHSCHDDQAAGYDSMLDEAPPIDDTDVHVRRCCLRSLPARFELKEILARKAAREAEK